MFNTFKHTAGATAAATLAAALSLNAAHAAPYPERSIQIVVPVAPGGNTDIATRLLAAKLKDRLHQSVVVENRTGAGGGIGADYVARAKPDGYTLLSASNGQLAVNPAVNKKLSYDPIRDFAPIGLISRVPLALTVPADSPITTLAAFIDASKNKAGGLTIGTSGTGGAHHLVMEAFASQTGAKLIQVPYRGGNAIIPDLIAGSIDGTFNELPNVIALHREGRARIIAIASSDRAALLPTIPTFDQAGVKGFTAYSSNGWLAPAGTPADVVETLRAALVEALHDPAVRKRFEEMALVIAPEAETSPDQYGAIMQRDLEAARRTVAEHNISIE